MRQVMFGYFAGEKHAALALVAAAIVSFTAAVVLFAPRWELRPLAVTLGIFSLVFLAIGVGLHQRTGPQVDELAARLASEPGRFYSEETLRMIKVQRNFLIIEYVELGIIVASAIAAVACKHRPAFLGVALGFLVNAAFLLAFDLVAERRGAVYLAALETRR